MSENPTGHSGIAASWCPVCGDCVCPRHSDGDWIDDPDALAKAVERRGECPLHGFGSSHDRAPGDARKEHLDGHISRFGDGVPAIQEYWGALAEVRRRRGDGKQWSEDDVKAERADMAALEDLHDALTPQERRIVNTAGWRAWPGVVGITQAALLVDGFTWTLQPPARHDRIARFWIEVTRKDSIPEHVEGFMTSEGVFVDRCEAMSIALRARQVFEEAGADDERRMLREATGLTTEDLW